MLYKSNFKPGKHNKNILETDTQKPITYICNGCSQELPSGIMNYMNHSFECPKDNPSEPVKYKMYNDPMFSISAEQREKWIENDRRNEEREKDFNSVYKFMSEFEKQNIMMLSIGPKMGDIIYVSSDQLRNIIAFQNEMIIKYKRKR